MRPLAPVIALVLLSAACTGDDPQAEPTAAPTRPPSATLIAKNLTMFPGEENATRIGFSPFEPSARLIVRYRPAEAQVRICPLPSFDAAIPQPQGCRRDVRSGVREEIVERGMRAIAIVAGPGSNALDAEVVLEYAEADRDVRIGLAALRAPRGGADCDDNRCNPFFELLPTRAGRFRATARWDGPEAVFVLLQGSVLGGAETSTGIPYREPARAHGRSPLRLSTSLSAPGEYALALRHGGVGASRPPLRAIELDVGWP